MLGAFDGQVFCTFNVDFDEIGFEMVLGDDFVEGGGLGCPICRVFYDGGVFARAV